MANLIVVWAALFAACAAAGWAVLRPSRGFSFTSGDLWLHFWAGWGLLLLFLQVWHLFAPVSWLAGALWGLLGIACLLLSLRDRFRTRETAGNSPVLEPKPAWNAGYRPVFQAVALLIVLWTAYLALGPLENGDSGLYHLGTVRWNLSYPIVPGLANLHTRFGYNSSYFLYAALLEPPLVPAGGGNPEAQFAGSSYHFANGLLLAVFGLGLLHSLHRVVAGASKAGPADLFLAVFILFLPKLTAENAASLSNDLPIFCLGAVIGYLLCRLLTDVGDPGEPGWLMAVMLVCVSAGISVKLSFAALGGCSATAATAVLIRRRIQAGQPRLERKVLPWLLAGLTVLVWIGRGYLLSGYPLFPSTLGGLPFEWRVPSAVAENESRVISSWGRTPHAPPEEVLGSWDWLLPKLVKGLGRLQEFILPLGICLLSLLGALWGWRGGGLPPFRRREAWLFLPPVLGLAFWFFSAPNIRFAGAAFWWLGAAGLVFARPGEGMRRWLAVLVGLAAAGIWLGMLCMGGLRALPAAQSGLLPIPATETREFVTTSGLRLNVPLDEDRCWVAPLPCTPYPDPRLELRVPGEMGSGFLIR